MIQEQGEESLPAHRELEAESAAHGRSSRGMVPVPLALGSSGAIPRSLPGGPGLVHGNGSFMPAAGQPERR